MAVCVCVCKREIHFMENAWTEQPLLGLYMLTDLLNMPQSANGWREQNTPTYFKHISISINQVHRTTAVCVCRSPKTWPPGFTSPVEYKQHSDFMAIVFRVAVVSGFMLGSILL